MDLRDLGWREPFISSFAELNRDRALFPARVVEEQREAFWVAGADGEFFAEISGRMRYLAADRADFPAVGDWVGIEPRLADRQATIHFLVPRVSTVSRKAAGAETVQQVIAANVDTVFVVTSLNRDLNDRRLERYIAMTAESGAEPVVLLNKSDLVPDAADVAEATKPYVAGATVHAVSALTGDGVDLLTPYLAKGRTVCLVGSSGVGKSTLINRLLGADRLKVNEVREKDDRGRHTTTARHMFALPQGGLLIDTPGMREITLWGDDGLEQAFPEIAALAAQCKFTDCKHEESDPGCAVQKALESEELLQERWDAYLKLQKEAAYVARKKDKRVEAQHKKKWKKIHSDYKKIVARKRGL
jgi:ribosome biogenesis GTPase / thiamine phosphate phosphatase